MQSTVQSESLGSGEDRSEKKTKKDKDSKKEKSKRKHESSKKGRKEENKRDKKHKKHRSGERSEKDLKEKKEKKRKRDESSSSSEDGSSSSDDDNTRRSVITGLSLHYMRSFCRIVKSDSILSSTYAFEEDTIISTPHPIQCVRLNRRQVTKHGAFLIFIQLREEDQNE